MDIKVRERNLQHLAETNVILGKNGCGKSFLLKQIEASLRGSTEFGKVRYISPERGGLLQYEPNIDQAISQNPTWIAEQRHRNQSGNFRQQSATLFRRLELLVLREIEADHTKVGYTPRNFGTVIDSMNMLLDRVLLQRDSIKAFRIVRRDSHTEVSPEEISSGESELISLGIEFLVFAKECEQQKANVLLVDEPDVHLHPDLQDRLCSFIVATLDRQPITLILATHSTALLAGLADRAEVRVAFMRRNDVSLSFKAVSEVDKAILPIFGAHPLSNVFNQAPVLLVEGEDDMRIWQTAVRCSNGRIRVYPCAVEGKPNFSEYESEVNRIIEAVYDNAIAYSLRDRDLEPEAIDDLGHIRRMRLACRAAENLMLSNECLALSGATWNDFLPRIRQWCELNSNHQYSREVSGFLENGADRKAHDLKNLRNILVGLLSNKPWEVLVGQAIASLNKLEQVSTEGSLQEFLGEKVCEILISSNDRG